MSLTIANQRPTQLEPLNPMPIAGQHDPVGALRKYVIDPLLQPLGSAPVTVTDAKGTSYDADEITQILVNCLGDDIDTDAEDFMRELFAQTLFHFDRHPQLTIDMLFTNQAGTRMKMPVAVPMRCEYVADDVVAAARKVLAGQDDGAELNVALTYTYKPDTLGFWFQTEQAFEDFKTWARQHTSSFQQTLPTDTRNTLNQFLTSTSLSGLTESLLLRGDDSENNDEYSFARLVVHLLTQYSDAQVKSAQQNPGTQVAGILPMSLAQLYVPRSVVLVNVEKHSRARTRRINAEWNLIKSALSTIPKIVPNSRMNRLTAMQRAAKKSISQAANSASNKRAQMGRVMKMQMRKNPVSTVDLTKDITKVLKRMGKVNRSQNIFRMTKTSYAKANRRDPDDYNRPGRITSVVYMPDIHLYIDASGSISEENWRDTVVMMIHIARKLEVNLYISFFTTALTQETLVRTSGKSVAQIWQQIKRLPRITGGTSYDQIWSYVNRNKERRRRLSIVLTDFEWIVPRAQHEHPKNLYYAPCSNMDWSRMQYWAKRYIRQMQHIEPDMPRRMMGMFG